ncbi:ribosome-assembly protein 3-domain-containing protein [Astrocystis sublimbata]|nr:ribosome-assembly protein 3-domain-containing protein [Astrocystis sublimbata]
MAGKADAAGFTSYYLQQSTKEFAEDLDKIRSADDFKGDALPMLINSLQQGTSMFSAADQRRIANARKDDAAAAAAAAAGMGDNSEGEAESTT